MSDPRPASNARLDSRTMCAARRMPSYASSVIPPSSSGGCGRPKSGAAEILADLDDAAADGAGAGEVLEQRFAVAAADRAGELRQILVEGAEHFQHGFLVVQEHVAPHRRVGRRDAGEIAKAAGGELDHLRRRHLRQFVGGADDGVGDQMRQMAGDRQHQVMMIGVMISTLAPTPAQNARSFSTAIGIGAVGRREDAPAVDEEFGEAGVGPGMLGAGDRMRRNEMNVGRQMRRHLADDRALDRADIGDDRARLEDAARSPARPARRRRPECRGSRGRRP